MFTFILNLNFVFYPCLMPQMRAQVDWNIIFWTLKTLYFLMFTGVCMQSTHRQNDECGFGIKSLIRSISVIIKAVLKERINGSQTYTWGTEYLSSIEGQLSFFDEAEAAYDESVPEPEAEDVLPSKRSKKKKGQRNFNLKDFPEEIIPPYSVNEERLDAFYGKGNWRRMSEQMVNTRMSLCVETDQRICSETVSLRHRFWPPSWM